MFVGAARLVGFLLSTRLVPLYSELCRPIFRFIRSLPDESQPRCTSKGRGVSVAWIIVSPSGSINIVAISHLESDYHLFLHEGHQPIVSATDSGRALHPFQ